MHKHTIEENRKYILDKVQKIQDDMEEVEREWKWYVAIIVVGIIAILILSLKYIK